MLQLASFVGYGICKQLSYEMKTIRLQLDFLPISTKINSFIIVVNSEENRLESMNYTFYALCFLVTANKSFLNLSSSA